MIRLFPSPHGGGRFRSGPTANGVWVAAVLVACSPAWAGVLLPRDLAQQLDWIGVGDGGVVVYGEIVSSCVEEVEGSASWTALEIDVIERLDDSAKLDRVVAFTPGTTDRPNSLAPPESERQVGERVLVFLAVDGSIRDQHAGAFKVHSHAEVFRTQRNRRGEVVILGEGTGTAVPSNILLAELRPRVEALSRAARAHHVEGLGGEIGGEGGR